MIQAFRRHAAALTCALLTFTPVRAAPPLAAWHHTAWTAADGAPAQISAMAQTRDGWLWLGTADGLYRFDGVAFERVPLPQRGMLGRALIYTLHADTSGGLLISHVRAGISRLHADGRFEDIPDLPGASMGPVSALDGDAAGTIWAMGDNGVYAYARGAWRTVADGAKWVSDDTRSLLRDQDGTLWASFDNQVWRLDGASGRFVAAGPPGARGALMQAPDGAVWSTQGDRVVRVSGPAGTQGPRRDERVNQAESRLGQFDRTGNLWKMHCPVSACLVPGDAVQGAVLDPAAAGQALAPGRDVAGTDTAQVLEDREGNVWIATEGSLDRYQRKALRHSGLRGSGTPISLAADADGGVWAADSTDGTLWRLQAGSAPVRQPDAYVRVVGTDRRGALLLSGRRSIERRLHGVVTRIPLPARPDGTVADLNVVGTLDDGKVLWMASYETGLMGYVDGAWRPRSAFNLPPKIVISSAGAPGQLWLADGDGGLTLYDAGKLTRYDARMAGIASAVFAGSEVMVAGERGLAVLQRGAMRLLHAGEPGAARPDVLRNISGMAITPDGDRWFNGAAGIVHVRARDWQRALDDPDALLSYQLLDARDGYPGQAAAMNRLPTVVQAAGGQLWFAATGGVVSLETRLLRRNAVAPTVQIQAVNTAQASYRANAGAAPGVALPPGSSNFTIAWTAPALRRPENLHYTYRLEGIDHGWRDGAASRTASYTNVGPGRYRFHVRVANEDGTPGAAEAVQAVTVAATLVQTAWFRALCVLLLILLGVALYRYRIRVLTARLLERVQVRASERERIARTLHDTYLQSVNALLLRVGAMAQSLPAGSATRARLETVLADASRAVVEGRGQVEQLRAPLDARATELDAILAEAAAPLRTCYPDVAFSMQVTGTRRPLLPAVLDEAAQIGAEALRNAFIHAGATRIQVHIDYGTPFSLVVADDGKGLDDAVRQQGYRSGHWGLLGMRERARGIGGQVVIDSARGIGTTIRLTVRRAYCATGWQGFMARWRRH
jgi:signal transduction histidine kinase/ligand-binding sensor domain-containing protein